MATLRDMHARDRAAARLVFAVKQRLDACGIVYSEDHIIRGDPTEPKADRPMVLYPPESVSSRADSTWEECVAGFDAVGAALGEKFFLDVRHEDGKEDEAGVFVYGRKDGWV